MREIAHFFWYGELSKLETSCIQSFVRHGFKVNLWSFTNLSLPGVISQDAREILPEEKLKLYKHNDTPHKPSLAIFASVFRYNLLSKKGGWWFDTDCYCLKDQHEFKNLRSNYSFVAGQQQPLIMPDSINNAVIFSTKEAGNILLNKINPILSFYKKNLFPWGRIGPLFITHLINRNKIPNSHIFSIDYFYSINWVDYNIFIDPTKLKIGKRKIKNSYVSHIWDNYILKNNVDKNNPPLGSLLEKMYNQEI